ncbi:MAG: hypothetical protein A4S14_15640 [Proteobacteria bacterium SG_bin9]|nr:MAG: hypothetical protein A4S14_15640 [Proteobacteria bacterium SG_bin9]
MLADGQLEIGLVSLSRVRRIGRWGAWAAAYALILNAILTSALAAAIPPDQFATSYELCLSGKHFTDKADQADDIGFATQKDQKGSPVHCPMCMPHLSAVDLPVEPQLAIRVAVASPLSFPAHEPFLALARIIFHHARGPPHLS